MSIVFKKKAFTLFELMIVIVIIGAVYALLIQNINLNPNNQMSLSLENLPSYMRKTFSKSKEKVEFICVNNCSTCKFKIGQSDSNSSVELFEPYSAPEAYTLVNDSLQLIEFDEIYEDGKVKKVCFKYTLYPNKSSDKMVLSYKDKVYLYNNLYKKTKVFQRMSDAQEDWINVRDEAKED